MNSWAFLLDVIILLMVAMTLGVLFERLRQSAIVGYLATGMILGPHALNLVDNPAVVSGMAELGVALLLFTIGLELSWRKFLKMGPVAIGGGALQVIVTAGLAALACRAAGFGWRTAIALGVLAAPSSTACILRLLQERTEMDSVHGRAAVGIALFQDLALVPMVLLFTLLSGLEGAANPIKGTAKALGNVALLTAIFWLLRRYVYPRLLSAAALSRNRELPVLLAIATCLGAAWMAHSLGISPALGAFIAGMLLAESIFAPQMRADIAGLRTIFVTLFFVSVGMMAELRWIRQNILLVTCVLAAVIIFKTVVVWGVLLIFRQAHRYALAAGLCLSQVGEFSFVLGQIGAAGGILKDGQLRLLGAVTVASLGLSPYLIAAASRLGRRLESLLVPARAGAPPHSPDEGGEESAAERTAAMRGHVIVVGFGPAGQGVVTALKKRNILPVILELNPRTAQAARKIGLRVEVGDATQDETLRHLGIQHALAAAVTIPDHRASDQIIRQIRSLAPGLVIIARARYHLYAEDLRRAGANLVINEEQETGALLGQAILGQIENPPSRNSIPKP